MTKGGITIGIDIGGTFTDFIAVDATTGRTHLWKTLTTPKDPVEGVAIGLAGLIEDAGLMPGDVTVAVHATTLITNAIIERKGATTGLITTAGFADLIEIGREVRYDLYDIFLTMPEPLVPDERRVEVAERIGAGGEVVEMLDEQAVAAAAGSLANLNVEAIAVCFLHSYANDEHERRAAEIIAGLHPNLSISHSAGVAREIREYERFSTAVANAYVQPLAGRYLGRMRGALDSAGIRAPLRIMLSSGGITTVESAARLPVRLVESGPAAGALAAGYYGSRAGVHRVLGFDMGGTTAKLCLIEDGQPAVGHGLEVARVHRFKRGSGLPIRAPSVELIEIGAGGGSIARVDELGLLTVGPDSAASDPGPASYGFGGRLPTVTDADLLLGYLNPDYFLGGAMRLDPDAAGRALQDQLASRLGIDLERIAYGIHDVVNENMATAAGVYIAERGRDQREYTLVATGGAGPVHACAVARKLGLRRVLIPPAAGVASAGGLLVAPPRMDFAHSDLALLDEVDWDRAATIFEGMVAEGREALLETGARPDDITITGSVDMRYVNQGHEVPVRLPSIQIGPELGSALREAFEQVYLELFGRTIPGVPLEVVTWRATVQGAAPRVSLSTGRSNTEVERANVQSRPAYFDGGFISTPVIPRESLTPGDEGAGPAIIEEAESTTVVGPQDRFEVDQWGNLIITLG